MAEVIRLEVQSRGKCSLVVVADLDADIGVVASMRVDAKASFGDYDGCVDIAVVALG